MPHILGKDRYDIPEKLFDQMDPLARVLMNYMPASKPPGGRDMVNVVGEIGDKMQVSQESDRMYKGSMAKKIDHKTFYHD